jgi:hypothetical protein
MSETRESFVESLTAAVRDNPLSAALIGGGALWLLIGNDNLKRAANSAAAAAAPLADIRARDRTARMQDGASRRLGDTARDAGSAASDAISNAADTISDRFDDGLTGAREAWERLGRALPGKESLAQAQSSLSELFERQPLVLGAVGVAIGASVAGALAKSSLEDEWVGEFSDSVKADLNVRAEAVSQSVREAADTLKAEFVDAGDEYVDRVQQAGRHALGAAREKVIP